MPPLRGPRRSPMTMLWSKGWRAPSRPPPGETFSGAGGTAWEAAAGVPHGQIRITTAGSIRAGGGTVGFTRGYTPTGAINPAHVGITLGPGGSTFGPLVRNPIPKFLRPR